MHSLACVIMEICCFLQALDFIYFGWQCSLSYLFCGTTYSQRQDSLVCYRCCKKNKATWWSHSVMLFFDLELRSKGTSCNRKNCSDWRASGITKLMDTRQNTFGDEYLAIHNLHICFIDSPHGLILTHICGLVCSVQIAWSSKMFG